MPTWPAILFTVFGLVLFSKLMFLAIHGVHAGVAYSTTFLMATIKTKRRSVGLQPLEFTVSFHSRLVCCCWTGSTKRTLALNVNWWSYLIPKIVVMVAVVLSRTHANAMFGGTMLIQHYPS